MQNITMEMLERIIKGTWMCVSVEFMVYSSVFVRYIDIETGKYETKIVNKNQK